MNAEQLDLFDMIGDPVTPEIPPEEQKKGVKGWIIDISAILLKKNGFREDAICVCTQPVQFVEDTKKDKHGRWDQSAQSIHGPMHGWYGPYHTVYAQRPTWEECKKYVRSRYSIPEKILYMERDGNDKECWDYEQGYKKGSKSK